MEEFWPRSAACCRSTIPAAPQHSWLVIERLAGRQFHRAGPVFHKSFGLTGLVVTKLDGTSRGGAIVESGANEAADLLCRPR